MSRFVMGGLLALVIAAAPVRAASGPWTTWIRPFDYGDLLTEGDTVWCATLEAGLLVFQRSSGRFENIVREPGGLASNQLTVLARDRSGRLWTGTRGAGVSVLSADRSTWALLSAFDGLPSDTIQVIVADGDTVWIGTRRGIALWNGREVSGVLPDGVNPSPFASNSITGVQPLGDTVWVATRLGIYRSLRSEGLATWKSANLGLPTGDVEALASDGASLFALDSLRVFRRPPGDDRWVEEGGIGEVRRLAEDLRTVTAASGRGIFRWRGTGWDSVNAALVSTGSARRRHFAVTVDSADRVLAAHMDGLYEQPEGPGPWRSYFPPSPPGNNITNLVREGARLYVATFNEGVGRYHAGRWRYWFPGQGGGDTSFRNPVFAFAMLADRAGRKWVGCWDQAVESFADDFEPPTFTHHWPVAHPPASGDTVRQHTFAWAAALDSSGGHWFGMDTNDDLVPPIGLEYYDASGTYVANYRPVSSPLRSGKIHALTVSRNGRVWVGYTGQGIDFFTPPEPGGRLLLQTVSGTDQFDVQGLVAHEDDLWVLTTSEVRRYSTLATFEEDFELPAGPSPLGLRPLDVAADGTVWLGTTNGVRVYRPDGTTQDYNASNSPLADEEVRAVLVDPATGQVWIGTAGGLHRFDPGFVAAPTPPLPRLELQVYPNPARLSGLGLTLRLAGNADRYRGRIYDLGGRLVWTFSAASNGQAIWRGMDRDGRLVRPGIYFVHVEAGGRSGLVRVALLR